MAPSIKGLFQEAPGHRKARLFLQDGFEGSVHGWTESTVLCQSEGFSLLLFFPRKDADGELELLGVIFALAMGYPEQASSITTTITITHPPVEQELCSNVGIIDNSTTRDASGSFILGSIKIPPDVRTVSIDSPVTSKLVFSYVTRNTFNGYLGIADVAVNKPQLTGIFMMLDLACQRRLEVTPFVAALVSDKLANNLLHCVRSFPGQRLPANRTVFVLLAKFPVTFGAENVVMLASVDWGLPNGGQAHGTLKGFHQLHHHIIRIFGLCARHLRRRVSDWLLVVILLVLFF